MSTTAKSSTWTGWAAFAAVILLVSGIFSLLQGLVLLIGPQVYYTVVGGSLFLFDVAGWGWWNVVVGALLVVTALCMLAGQVWARVIGIVLAVLSAAGQLLLIPAQPWWAVVVIAIDVFVIYALTTHGDELEKRRA